MEFALPKNLYLEVDALHHPLCRTLRVVVSDGSRTTPPGPGIEAGVGLLKIVPQLRYTGVLIQTSTLRTLRGNSCCS